MHMVDGVGKLGLTESNSTKDELEILILVDFYGWTFDDLAGGYKKIFQVF